MSDRPPRARVRYRVVALTLLLVAIAYLDRVCISTAAPAIQSELGLSDAEMGLVFSAFTMAYAIFEIPSGWFADRFGPRIALTRIVVFWSVMTAATGLATGFMSLVTLRLLFGAGEAGAFPATARAYRSWLPEGERGRAFGLSIMTGAIGGALTQPLVVALLGRYSWRTAFALFGSVGLLWAAVFWWWFRDEPSAHRAVTSEELAAIHSDASTRRAARLERRDAAARGGPETGSRAAGLRPKAGGSGETSGFRSMLVSRTTIALCVIYAGTIYGWYFYLTWLPTYLLQARGFDLKKVGWLSSAPLLGIAAGVFAGGLLADLLPRRIGPRWGRKVQGLIGLPCAAGAVLFAAITTSASASAALLALAACFAALGVAPAWALCVEIGGDSAGVVSGAMNMCGNFGGAMSSAVIGFFLSRFGHSGAAAGASAASGPAAAIAGSGLPGASRAAYTFASVLVDPWQSGLLTIAALYAIAALFWLLVEPAPAAEQQDQEIRSAALRAG